MIKRLFPVSFALFVLFLPAYTQILQINTQVVAIITKDDTGKALGFPTGVYYNRKTEDILIVDAPKAKIIFYTPEFFPYFSIGRGRGVLVPTGITTDQNGFLYVSQGLGALNPKTPKISIFNGAGIWVKDIVVKVEGKPFVPAAIAIGKNNKVYVISYGKPGCAVLNKEGKLIKLIKPKDTISPDEPEKEATLSDVYIDSKGRIYLLSEEMGRVYVYDERENFLFKAGQKGGTPGKLSRPRGVAADPSAGFIYITDYMRHCVQILDYDTGKYIGEIGGRGWGPGWFNYPGDITVDSRGYIYVCDLFNNRVQVLKVIASFETLKSENVTSNATPQDQKK